MLDFLQFSTDSVEKTTVQFAEHFEQKGPNLHLQIAPIFLNTGNDSLEEDSLRIYALSFSTPDQPFQNFKRNRWKLFMRQHSRRLAECIFHFFGELGGVDRGRALRAVDGEERRTGIAPSHLIYTHLNTQTDTHNPHIYKINKG
jgi:hypothetical protein